MRYQKCHQCGKKCPATLNMCPTCYPPHKPSKEAKHTPGPWTFGKGKEWTTKDGAARLVDGKGWFIGPEGQGLDIAQVHQTASQDVKVQEANARLMAAAPELLAALQAVLDWGTRECMPSGGKGDCPFEIIEAVVKKATGK